MAKAARIRNSLIQSAEYDPAVDVDDVIIGKGKIRMSGTYSHPTSGILDFEGVFTTINNHRLVKFIQYTYSNRSGYVSLAIDANNPTRGQAAELLGAFFGSSNPQALVSNLDALPAVNDAYIYGTINGQNIWFT
jgi:hypothetical protein